MNTKYSKYLKLKKAMISLQCVQRCIVAREVLFELRKAAKDIGNLKEDNAQLKIEMGSLKAMLKAQSETKHNRTEDLEALRKKDEEILVLSKQLSKCEVELSNEREARDEIEKSFKEENELRIKLEKEVEDKKKIDDISGSGRKLERTISDTAERIQNMAIITKMERELEHERQSRYEADIENVKMRKTVEDMKQNQTMFASNPPLYVESEVSVNLGSDFQSQMERELKHERQSRYEAEIEIAKMRKIFEEMKQNQTMFASNPPPYHAESEVRVNLGSDFQSLTEKAGTEIINEEPVEDLSIRDTSVSKKDGLESIQENYESKSEEGLVSNPSSGRQEHEINLKNDGSFTQPSSEDVTVEKSIQDEVKVGVSADNSKSVDCDLVKANGSSTENVTVERNLQTELKVVDIDNFTHSDQGKADGSSTQPSSEKVVTERHIQTGVEFVDLNANDVYSQLIDNDQVEAVVSSTHLCNEHVGGERQIQTEVGVDLNKSISNSFVKTQSTGSDQRLQKAIYTIDTGQDSKDIDMIVGFPTSKKIFEADPKSSGNKKIPPVHERSDESRKGLPTSSSFITPKSGSVVVDVSGWGEKSLVDDTSDEEEEPIGIAEATKEEIKEQSKNFEAENDSAVQEKAKEDMEEFKKIQQESVTPEVMKALKDLGINEAKDHPIFKFPDSVLNMQHSVSPSDFLPMIRQKSFIVQSADKILKSHKPTADIITRSEKETQLRNSMYKFEEQMSTFRDSFENGHDIVLWQRGISSPGFDDDEKFNVVNSHVMMKLVKHGEGLVMSEFMFAKSRSIIGHLGQHLRGTADKYVTDSLLVREILEIKAGCIGYSSGFLPTSRSSNTRSKDNKNSTLFLTIKATPTPVASSRSYFLKLKTRDERNNMLNGLRKVMADLQIEESTVTKQKHVPSSLAMKSPAGRRRIAGRSTLSNTADLKTSLVKEDELEDTSRTVSMSDVKGLIVKERANYECLLVQMMQGKDDMLEKEDEVLELRQTIESMAVAENEKSDIHKNDSKLIMQLSKKLEGLLISQEDMKETNEKLNGRLIEAECEKMNRYM